MPKTKRPWQPKKQKRVKKHGFMHRNSTVGGIRVLKARKAKGRHKLVVKYNGK
jgi:large subunit ribosomal protein L34